MEYSIFQMEEMVREANRWYHGPRQVAEDIVGDLVYEMCCKCQEPKIRSYMIKNRCIDRIRREQAEKKFKERYARHLENCPSSSDLSLDCQIEMAGLTNEEKRILYLRFWDGMSLLEIRQKFPNAKENLVSALSKIKEILELEKIVEKGQNQ